MRIGQGQGTGIGHKGRMGIGEGWRHDILG